MELKRLLTTYNKKLLREQVFFSRIEYIPVRRLKVAILKWPIPLADSAELAIFLENRQFFGESAIFWRISNFLENRQFLSTLCSEESARVQVGIGRRNRPLQNRHF